MHNKIRVTNFKFWFQKILTSVVQLATSGVYKDVWETNMNVNPANFYGYSDIENTIHRVQTEKFVHFGDYTFLAVSVANAGICDVAFSNDKV